jgi:hypothetical protein
MVTTDNATFLKRFDRHALDEQSVRDLMSGNLPDKPALRISLLGALAER